VTLSERDGRVAGERRESMVKEMTEYRCGACGAAGVKLFRLYQQAGTLLCLPCSEKEQGKEPGSTNLEVTDQIGWRVPAVPCGETFWGYMNIPEQGFSWWYALGEKESIMEKKKTLDEWREEVLENEDDALFFKKVAQTQVKVLQDLGLRNCCVCGEHESKSVRLPVVEGRAGTALVRIRGNFYDWKVSVENDEPVSIDTRWRFDPSKEPKYFEGFKEEWVYPPYAVSPLRFSLELPYELVTLIELIGQIKRGTSGERREK
jgi:hypothetical protein